MERGIPETPYLAEANCIIEAVTYNNSDKEFKIKYSDILDHNVYFVVISPFPINNHVINGLKASDLLNVIESNGIYKYIFHIKSKYNKNEICLFFN